MGEVDLECDEGPLPTGFQLASGIIPLCSVSSSFEHTRGSILFSHCRLRRQRLYPDGVSVAILSRVYRPTSEVGPSGQFSVLRKSSAPPLPSDTCKPSPPSAPQASRPKPDMTCQMPMPPESGEGGKSRAQRDPARFCLPGACGGACKDGSRSLPLSCLWAFFSGPLPPQSCLGNWEPTWLQVVNQSSCTHTARCLSPVQADGTASCAFASDLPVRIDGWIAEGFMMMGLLSLFYIAGIRRVEEMRFAIEEMPNKKSTYQRETPMKRG
jgi:hypothetical protein